MAATWLIKHKAEDDILFSLNIFWETWLSLSCASFGRHHVHRSVGRRAQRTIHIKHQALFLFETTTTTTTTTTKNNNNKNNNKNKLKTNKQTNNNKTQNKTKTKQNKKKKTNKKYNYVVYILFIRWMLPYLPYVFGQTGLSKQCTPRWDVAERGASSGVTLYATTHSAIFRHNIG